MRITFINYFFFKSRDPDVTHILYQKKKEKRKKKKGFILCFLKIYEQRELKKKIEV